MTTTENIEIKILRGLPINVGFATVHPLILDQIANIGEDKYNIYLNTISFRDSESSVDGRKLTQYESAILYSHHEITFRQLFLEALSLFIKEPVQYHEQGFFYLGNLDEERFIDEVRFNQIQEVIKKQNFLRDTEERQFKPFNAKAQELLDKKRQIESRIKKQNNDDGINLSDIISIVSSYTPNINIFNVWDLTVYQLYQLYLRLMLRDQYESNFYLLPHSSDPKSLELKHWATKLKQ